MGKILASVSHEMQNVMAIIKESGSLADDILDLNGPPRMRHGDKLDTALHNIQTQVRRGSELMHMLNGFAHAATDHPKSGDLPRFAKQIFALADRSVRMAQCTWQLELGADSLQADGNALMLMQTLYLGMEAVLAVCGPGEHIHVTLRAEGQNTPSAYAARVRIAVPANTQTPDASRLSPIMEELRGACEAGAGFLDLLYAPPHGQGGLCP